MEKDELADPEAVGLFRPGTEMAAPANDRDLVEQARAVGGGIVTP